MPHPSQSRPLLVALICCTTAFAGCRQTGVRIPGFPDRERTGAPTLLQNDDDDGTAPLYEELPPSPSAATRPATDDADAATWPAGFENGPEADETANENGSSDDEPLPVIIPARPRQLVPLREPDGPIAALETPGPQLDALQFLAELTAENPSPTPHYPVAATPPTLAPALQPVPVVRTPTGVDSWPREGVPAKIVVCPGPVARSLVQPVPRIVQQTRSWAIGSFE